MKKFKITLVMGVVVLSLLFGCGNKLSEQTTIDATANVVDTADTAVVRDRTDKPVAIPRDGQDEASVLDDAADLSQQELEESLRLMQEISNDITGMGSSIDGLDENEDL